MLVSEILNEARKFIRFDATTMAIVTDIIYSCRYIIRQKKFANYPVVTDTLSAIDIDNNINDIDKMISDYETLSIEDLKKEPALTNAKQLIDTRIDILYKAMLSTKPTPGIEYEE